MRVAVISDVHGNLHALEAVLEAIGKERVDEIWSLGDDVGYGPLPNECCYTIEQRAAISLAGNHDLAAIGELSLTEFAPAAADAISWTREHLSERARAYLASLAPMSRVHGCELFHGSPEEPVWSYVLTGAEIEQAFALTTEPLVLVGHTHLALVASLTREIEYDLAAAGTAVDLGSGRWLLNPGSVGQPRDGDPRAAYLLLDLDAAKAEFKRVDYPIERTQTEMRERMLPPQLADRLAHGL
jgi:predicted phosphodiesterase